MEIDVDKLEVVNNEEAKRFEVDLGDGIAMVEYMIAGKNMIFPHTEVPEKYEGQGIARKMVSVALEYAKNEGYKIQATCPIVSAYIAKHPEYHPITWGY